MNCRILVFTLFSLFQAHVGEVESLKVDIYPGYGWDNLRYLDMNPIYDVSNLNDSWIFQSCIELIPIRQNKLSLGSEVIDVFDSRTHDYSSNTMISAKGGYLTFRIGGSYSYEYQNVKRQQGEEQTITLRNQIEYLMVDVLLKPSCPLNPQVKNDLIEIAGYIENEETAMATYAAQLFVKNYGTHFTNRIHLGGSLIEEDFILHDNFQSNEETRRSYRATAEASFMNTFSISGKFSTSSTTIDNSTEGFKKMITRKIVHTRGGVVSLLENSMNTWQTSVEANPVIIRRAVENITFFIDSHKIPELSEVALMRVIEKIDQAVETYIQMNVYSGCMNRSSPSFTWIANVDDDSCLPAGINSQFGGFIRTCTENSRLPQKCSEYKMNNFYTQTEECPLGFDKYLLHQSTQSETVYRRECRSCKFHTRRCCDDIPDGVGQREIKLYVCNSKTKLRDSSSGLLSVSNRYVYGGSFTSVRVNPITGTYKCPNDQFKMVQVTSDLKICLADQVIDTSNLPHYGGMFSCSQGNVLLPSVEKECAEGYSSYVMSAIEDSCLLYVCLKFEKSPEVQQLPSVVLPPFFSISLKNQSKPVVNLTNMPDSYISTTTTTTPSTTKVDNKILGISIASLLVTMLIAIAFIIFLVRTKRRYGAY
ncbi:unnamed protein product [Adineta steineri]|uniref:MACPF domain-containing protein n=1 Tax=Adineta steineri TaxID=433720 RepID=A0A814PZ48_9BILA|nr:unnamed protein product [Adineta steineri]CAF1112275.1 unnamed protein product [Adineta steineri]